MNQKTNEKPYRKLVYHPESDCLFEVFSEEEWFKTKDGEPLCEDATGIEHLEKIFAEEQKALKEKQ